MVWQTACDMLCDQLHNIFWVWQKSSCSLNTAVFFVLDAVGSAQRKTGCSCPVKSRYVEAGMVFKWICTERPNLNLKQNVISSLWDVYDKVKSYCACKESFHPSSPLRQHLSGSGWSCRAVLQQHSARRSRWCGARHECLLSLLYRPASDCKSATEKEK